MRPVTKKTIGESIMLGNGTTHVIQEEYKPYGNARPILLTNLGRYCSYCEQAFLCGSNLQTEHIQPKGLDVNGIKPYAEFINQMGEFFIRMRNLQW